MTDNSVLQECHDMANGKRAIANRKAYQKVAKINNQRELNIMLSKTRTELKKLADNYLAKNVEERAILKRLKQLQKGEFQQLKLY